MDNLSLRADQRARILRALVQVAAEQGYGHATIGEIARVAGVSRATFYELFDSKQQCFLGAQRELGEALHARLASALHASRPDDAVSAALQTLGAVACEQPSAFSCLTQEALLAGDAPLLAREQLLEQLGELLDSATASGKSARASVPDLPARVLLGAAVRSLATGMRRHEHELLALGEQLIAWSDLYRVPAPARRWRSLEPERALLDAGHAQREHLAFAPQSSPRGRHRQPAALVSRTQRERILHATAAVVAEKGYEHSSVADIVAAAGVSRDVFYNHVRSRRDALEQATRMFVEHIIAAMAGVFFTSSGSWAERLWEAGVTLAAELAGAPSFTRVACIDSYAPDLAAARRSDELLLSFSVFIDQGAREQARRDASPPAIAPVAIIAALAESVVQFVTESRVEELPGLVPLGVYLALVPYTGPAEANAFIERKLAELEADGPPAERR